MTRQPAHWSHSWVAIAAFGCLSLLCIGFTALISSQLLTWPLSFGLPLFVAVMCFMAMTYTLARRTRLYPDHPSFASMQPAAVIAGMDQTRGRLLVTDVVGGALLIIIGITCLMAANPNSPMGSPLLLATAIVTLALSFALLAHSFTLIPWRSEQEYARHAGVAATARLLDITPLRSVRRLPAFDAARLYRLELEVLPPLGAPYRVTLEQLIRRRRLQMPAVGSLIPVKFLAEQPEVVVTLLDPADRPTVQP